MNVRVIMQDVAGHGLLDVTVVADTMSEAISRAVLLLPEASRNLVRYTYASPVVPHPPRRVAPGVEGTPASGPEDGNEALAECGR